MFTLTMPPQLSTPNTVFDYHTLRLDSQVQDLFLYQAEIEDTDLVEDVAGLLEDYPILPGIILIHQGNFAGMVSRRRFLERMSRPYSRELFMKRPIQSLYKFIQVDLEILPANTLIIKAAQYSLQRPLKMLYEPLVVQLDQNQYRLLDVHHLLVAQSQVHQLTNQLLDKSNYNHQVQTEKMVSLGRMVAGVAHEIRNPVNAVSGNIDFLFSYFENMLQLLQCYQEEATSKSCRIQQIEEEIDLEFILEDMPRLLQSMKIGSERLTQIITSLRNFSRMDDRKHQVINLRECLDGTLLILDHRLKREIEVIKDYHPIPDIECYPGQLSQVFMNLLSNAIDVLIEKKETVHSEEWSPKITICLKELQEENARPGVSVKIIDNGLGISAENQAKIFENFFTTKPLGKGTGLGLPISYQIVTETHQGALKFKSEVGVGTEFEIILPITLSSADEYAHSNSRH